MAPPGNRRPGHSRRAQYTTFIGYVIAFAGVALGVLLLIVSTRDASAFSGLRTTAADAAAPAGQLTASGRTEARGFFAVLGGFFTRGSRVAELEREVAAGRVARAEAQALEDENRRLKALLGLAEQDPRPVTVARLIASTSSSTRRFATLGAGTRQGVKVGMPVRSQLGLIGRVLEVGHSSARVLLITDGESVVPVRRARDGLPAFATGRADGSLQIRLINLGLNPLRKGDAIVASGSGGMYWSGTAIAVVSELTRDGAIAQPLSDPGNTDYVAVQPLAIAPVEAEAPAAATPAPAPKPTAKPSPAASASASASPEPR